MAAVLQVAAASYVTRRLQVLCAGGAEFDDKLFATMKQEGWTSSALAAIAIVVSTLHVARRT